MSERDRLVLWTPVLLALGIGFYFSLQNEPPMWMGSGLAIASVCLLYIFRKKMVFRLVSIALLLTALGFTVASLRTQLVAAPALYSTLYFRTVQGTVEDIQSREKGEKLVIGNLQIERVSPRTTPLRAGITFREKTPDLKIGDRIEVKAILFPPPTPAMPGANDFSRQYYYEQIGAVGFAPKPPVVLEHAGSLRFKSWLTELRLSISQRIMAAMSPEGGPVAAALMVGEMSAISEEVRKAMRDSGMYHVLSISGLHMSLAVGLLYVSIRFLLSLYPPLALRLPVKKMAAAMGLAGALLYLLLAGYPVPAVRSFIMVACVMLAILFDRSGISLYSLAWAATLILLMQPEALVGVSFQLSFAATLAIVAFYERYSYLLHMPHRNIFHRLRLYFLGLMATSLVASLATAPLVIYHFNRFTLWGVVANMLVMPLASFVIMPSAVLAFLAMPFGLEELPLAFLDTGIRWMLGSARWFSSMPLASLPVRPPSFTGMVLVVLGGLWLCLMSQRWRIAGVVVAVMGMASVALHQPYDLIISSDGKKVALRKENGQFVFLKGRSSSYDAEIWLRWHGQDTLAALSPSSGRLCDKGWCTSEAYGRKIAIAQDKQSMDMCAVQADIIITEGYADHISCVSGAQVIDRKFLLRNGAAGLRLKGGRLVMELAEEPRRGRPWSADTQYRLYHYNKQAITNP